MRLSIWLVLLGARCALADDPVLSSSTLTETSSLSSSVIIMFSTSSELSSQPLQTEPPVISTSPAPFPSPSSGPAIPDPQIPHQLRALHCFLILRMHGPKLSTRQEQRCGPNSITPFNWSRRVVTSFPEHVVWLCSRSGPTFLPRLFILPMLPVNMSMSRDFRLSTDVSFSHFFLYLARHLVSRAKGQPHYWRGPWQWWLFG